MRFCLKKVSIVTGLIVLLLSFSSIAGTSYSNYDTTVGKFNGNGYTGYQTKAKSGANGYINSSKVGGSYVVDARMNSSSGCGSWLRDLDDNDKCELPGHEKMKKGCDVRIQFSNDWNTPVGVQVKGKWKSN